MSTVDNKENLDFFTGESYEFLPFVKDEEDLKTKYAKITDVKDNVHLVFKLCSYDEGLNFDDIKRFCKLINDTEYVPVDILVDPGNRVFVRGFMSAFAYGCLSNFGNDDEYYEESIAELKDLIDTGALSVFYPVPHPNEINLIFRNFGVLIFLDSIDEKIE